MKDFYCLLLTISTRHELHMSSVWQVVNMMKYGTLVLPDCASEQMLSDQSLKGGAMLQKWRRKSHPWSPGGLQWEAVPAAAVVHLQAPSAFGLKPSHML